MMNDSHAEGTTEEMTTRDREIQASIWAMIFLISEFSLAFRTLRDKLTERGVLLPEDEDEINKLSCQEDRMRAAYKHTEMAFRDKYQRVFTAMTNPTEVTQAVQDNFEGGTTIDLNTVEVPNTENLEEPLIEGA